MKNQNQKKWLPRMYEQLTQKPQFEVRKTNLETSCKHGNEGKSENAKTNKQQNQ